ncbi:SphA family protein [Deferrisoma palaeochoriense]
MRRSITALGTLLALFLWAAPGGAVLIDPYDNIIAPDGYYGLVYLNYYHADELAGPDGDKAADIDLTATVAVVRPLAYFHVGPVAAAFQVIVPFGKVEESDLLDEDSSGLGDIIFGPGIFLYTNETTNTYVSYWFYAFAPTGEWDKDQTINLGQNHWYFEHQLAFNQLLGKWVFDMNLNYYHHTEEPDNDWKAPPRFELELSLAYQLTDKLVLGVNGGGYWDLDNGEADGTEVDDTKAKRVQFGPTLGYQVTERFGANLRWTHDLSAANDTKGDDVWLRFSYAF